MSHDDNPYQLDVHNTAAGVDPEAMERRWSGAEGGRIAPAISTRQGAAMKPFILLSQEIRSQCLAAAANADEALRRWSIARLVFDRILGEPSAIVGLVQEAVECHPRFPGGRCHAALVRSILVHEGYEPAHAAPHIRPRGEFWRLPQPAEAGEIEH